MRLERYINGQKPGNVVNIFKDALGYEAFAADVAGDTLGVPIRDTYGNAFISKNLSELVLLLGFAGYDTRKIYRVDLDGRCWNVNAKSKR